MVTHSEAERDGRNHSRRVSSGINYYFYDLTCAADQDDLSLSPSITEDGI